jgi:RND family efflux transporter MFP subunit
LFRLSILCLPVAALAGCEKPAPKLAETKPAEVQVALPLRQKIVSYEDFTGRTEPVNSVDLRAQVTGYLTKVHFKDGADVVAGAPLFDIDPRPYTAVAEQAKAALAQAEARRDRVRRDFDRLAKLEGTTAVSQEELDKIKGDKQEAEAAVAAARASLTLAETNLEYTHIKAPFTGRLSKRTIDEGNVVKANDTILTSIVALEPIYATFDVDERTLLQIRRLIAKGEADSARLTNVRVGVALADETSYAEHREGAISFIDNKVDPATGTLRLRATLTNKDGLLSPGLFVRVRVYVGREHDALLVPEEAVGADQGLKYVYIAGAKDEVEYRRVETGQQYGRYRVIDKGLTAEDRVIVIGLQRVKQGTRVNAKPFVPTSPPPPARG